MQNKYSDGSFRITITGSCDFEDDFYQIKKCPLFSGVDAESGRLFSYSGIYIDYHYDAEKDVLYMTSSFLNSYDELQVAKSLFSCIIDVYVIANMSIQVEFIYNSLSDVSILNIIRTACANEELQCAFSRLYDNPECAVLQKPELHSYLASNGACLKLNKVKPLLNSGEEVYLFDLQKVFDKPAIVSLYLGNNLDYLESLVCFYFHLLSYAIKSRKMHGHIKNVASMSYFRTRLMNIGLRGKEFLSIRKDLYKLFSEGYGLKEVDSYDSERIV